MGWRLVMGLVGRHGGGRVRHGVSVVSGSGAGRQSRTGSSSRRRSLLLGGCLSLTVPLIALVGAVAVAVGVVLT
jgi:hypothetical protein